MFVKRIWWKNVYIYNKYDTLQKLAVITFAQAILLAMGDERKVVRFYPTELIIPTFQNKFMDGVLELDDGTLMNLEFITGNVTEEFLLRCAQYSVNLRVISGRPVETNVISTGLKLKSENIASISNYFKFKPKIFFYSELDGSEKLINIKNKISNNEILTQNDHLDLIFIPFMTNVDKIEVAFEVFDIVNNEEIFTKDEQTLIKQCQYIVADIIADGDEELFDKFMERIIVLTLLSGFLKEKEKEIVEGFKEEARIEGLKEGREEGMEKGREEGMVKGSNEKAIEIACNMKNKYSDLEISEITGLNIEQVKKL